MVILHDENLDENIIARDVYPSGSIIVEIRYLFPSYLHIGLHTDDTKYRI